MITVSLAVGRDHRGIRRRPRRPRSGARAGRRSHQTRQRTAGLHQPVSRGDDAQPTGVRRHLGEAGQTALQRWKPLLDGDDPVLLDEDRRRAWTERLAVEEPKTLNCDHALVVLPSRNGQGWRYWRPDRGNSPARPAAQRGHAPAGRRLRRPLDVKQPDSAGRRSLCCHRVECNLMF
jgi:hypothetical protein